MCQCWIQQQTVSVIKSVKYFWKVQSSKKLEKFVEVNFIQQFEERFMYKNSLSFKNEINHFVMFITTNPGESPVVKTNDDTAEKLCL